MKTALLLGSILFFWGCSNGGSDSDPCQGVTCNNHGSCVVTSGNPGCNCDAGYYADGLSCLERQTEGCSSDLECNNGDGKTTCDLTTGSSTYKQCIEPQLFSCNQCQAWERCNDGNTACDLLVDKCNSDADCASRSDGQTKCGGNDAHSCVEPDVVVDPCKDQKCSGQGVCKVVNNSATCDCFSGFEADGLTCVSTATSCDTMSCGDNGTCTEVGGVRCLCDYHYVQSGGRCVFLVDLFNEALADSDQEKLDIFWTNYDGPIRWSGKILFVTRAQPEEQIKVAGDFNSWDPNTHPMSKPFDETFRFLETPVTNSDDEVIGYKYISGSGDWYADVDNHIYHFDNADNNSFAYPTNRSRLLKYDIPSPELGDDERTVFVYLPGAYFTTRIELAVIYMQDGHNLFDGNPEAIYGTWGVAGTLESMITANEMKPAIVIGIRPNERMDEYLYTAITRNGSQSTPKLDLYIKYLKETLIPVINRTFRVSTHKDDTVMAGSSLGGISSFMIGWQNSDIFGKVGVFSPSFWIGEPDGEDTADAQSVREMVQAATTVPELKIYLDCGNTDQDGSISYTSDSRVHTDHVRNALIAKGWDSRDEWLEDGEVAPIDYPTDTSYITVPTLFWRVDTPEGYSSYLDYLKPEHNLLHLVGEDHKHNEAAWRDRFRAAMMFLLPKQ